MKEYHLFHPSRTCEYFLFDSLAKGSIEDLAPQYLRLSTECLSSLLKFNRDNLYYRNKPFGLYDKILMELKPQNCIYENSDYEKPVSHDNILAKISVDTPEMRDYEKLCKEINNYNDIEIPEWKNLYEKNLHPGLSIAIENEKNEREFQEKMNRERYKEIMAENNYKLKYLDLENRINILEKKIQISSNS